jgi:large subunit ribosomal protein L3
MARAILGRKRGMTQAYQEDGTRVHLTLVEAGPCVVTRVKSTTGADRYDAVVVGFETVPERKSTKPVRGQTPGAGPFRFLRELRLSPGQAFEVGQSITVETFAAGDRIDVVGTSKGKGFQGTIKRHHFSRGPMTHGSMNKRPPGSVGASAWPSHVVKGKKLPGHMGDERVTVQNLTVFGVDPEKNLLLIRGAVPGAKNGVVLVRESVKKRRKAE